MLRETKLGESRARDSSHSDHKEERTHRPRACAVEHERPATSVSKSASIALGGDESGARLPIARASLSPTIFCGLVALADVSVVIGTGLAVYSVYPGWQADRDLLYILAIAATSLLALQAFSIAGLYSFELITETQRQMEKLLQVCIGIFLTVLACTFFFKVSSSLSRVWMACWISLTTFLLVLVRLWICSAVHKGARAGQLTRNVAIVGSGGQARKLLRYVERCPRPWVRVVGIFDDRIVRSDAQVMGHPVVGTLEDLKRFAREHRIDDVLVALPWAAESRIKHILGELKALPLRVALCPDLVGLEFPFSRYQRDLGVPVLNIFENPNTGWKFLVKRIFDHSVSATLLLLAAPLLAAIALLIKLTSPGPVFFVQNRYGFNNELIKVWKFRTMYVEAQDANAERLVVRGDPRVTPLGVLLRRTSLDELPQLLNVVKGEMSLVGPRPHALQAKAGGLLYEDAVSDYLVRHKMKPGITGWAQVNGWRGETDTVQKIQKRVEFDLYYIENWSLSLDLWILLRTVWVGFRFQNAY